MSSLLVVLVRCVGVLASRHRRWGILLLLPCVVFIATAERSGADLITYSAATGQTATADFRFVDGKHLQIMLTETTAPDASGLTGGPSVLTGVGFRLPGSAVITRKGSVTIGGGSASHGFSKG